MIWSIGNLDNISCAITTTDSTILITMTSHKRHGISSHQPLNSLFNSLLRLLRLAAKKASNLHIIGSLLGESTGGQGLAECQWCRKCFHVMLSSCLCPLTHWGWVMHICVGNLTIIASDNGLWPGWRQAIIWTIAGILLIRPLGINFSEILIKIHAFSFYKTYLKMSSVKRLPFCLSLNVIIYDLSTTDDHEEEEEGNETSSLIPLWFSLTPKPLLMFFRCCRFVYKLIWFLPR